MNLSTITDPKLRQRIERADREQNGSAKRPNSAPQRSPVTPGTILRQGLDAPHHQNRPGSNLNRTEQRYRDRLALTFYGKIYEQAITLRIDPPYRSYRPDLAHFIGETLHVVEVKASHRFKEKGIAKACLAAKQWPNIVFHLAEWTKNKAWKESVLAK